MRGKRCASAGARREDAVVVRAAHRRPARRLLHRPSPATAARSRRPQTLPNPRPPQQEEQDTFRPPPPASSLQGIAGP
jgi:hypothetical protein